LAVDASKGTYLYCFARAGAVHDIVSDGVDGRPGVAALEVGDVAAVCSPVCLAEFRHDAAGDHPPPDWIIPRACRHEQVIEEVMRCSPVLPVRFGAVFASRQGLERLVTARCQQIAGFLTDIADKEEWAVKGFMDLDRAETWLLESDPLLADRFRALPEAPGARYFQEKQLRGLARKQAKVGARTLVEQVGERLQELAVEARALRLQPPNLAAAAGEMVLNFACLLHQDRLAEFHACLGMLRSQHAGQGLMLECSGPWPPFNFCPNLEGEVP
jgi:hypothetical protein